MVPLVTAGNFIQHSKGDNAQFLEDFFFFKLEKNPAEIQTQRILDFAAPGAGTGAGGCSGMRAGAQPSPSDPSDEIASTNSWHLCTQNHYSMLFITKFKSLEAHTDQKPACFDLWSSN